MGFWLIIFATINAVCMTLISLTLGNWDTSLLGKLYLVCAMASQFTIISYVLALLIYFLTFFIASVKSRMGIYLAVFSIAQLIIITNLKVYTLYHFHLNNMVLNLILGGALLENLSFSAIMWFCIFAIVPIVVLLEYVIGGIAQRYTINTQRQAINIKARTAKYVVMAIIAMTCIQLLNGFADAFSWKDITLQNRYIPWMAAATMRKQISQMGFSISNGKNATLKNEFSALQYPLEPLTCTAQTPPNIVMLVVDSLRADMLTQEIMPHTSEIQKTSLSFIFLGVSSVL